MALTVPLRSNQQRDTGNRAAIVEAPQFPKDYKT